MKKSIKKKSKISFTTILIIFLLATSIYLIPTVIASPGIQDDINAASPGDTIILSAGTYSEGQITIDKPLTIQGAGKELTIIDATTFSYGFKVSADDVVIKDLKIQGATNRGITVQLAKSTPVNNLRLENVNATGCAYGVEIHQTIANNVYLKNCDFVFNTHGFSIDSGAVVDGLTIENCNASYNSGLGLYLEGKLTGLTLTGGDYSNNGDAAIYFLALNLDFATPKPTTISGCTITGNNRGIIPMRIYGGSDLIIEDVTITDNNQGIFMATMIGYPFNNVQIKNSVVSNNPGTGISILSRTGGEISGITIENCLLEQNMHGIRLGLSSYSEPHSDVLIQCNEILSNDYGIQLYNTENAEIHDNIINGNTIGIENNIGSGDVNQWVANATLNWWGDITGPYHPTSWTYDSTEITNPTGWGDEVSNYVLYNPWKGSAKWWKQDAINELEALYPTGDKHIDKEIKKAIKHIEKSLADKLWVENNRLDPKKDRKVFDEEEKAVEKLMKILKNKDASENLKEEVRKIINKLVESDEILASYAVFDAALSLDLDNPKVFHEIVKAIKEMTQAYNELGKEHYDKAIDHFGKAWEHAQKAIKKAS